MNYVHMIEYVMKWPIVCSYITHESTEIVQFSGNVVLMQNLDVAKSQHSIVWSGARVVKSVEGYWERTVEAIEIRRSKSSMNLDKGLLLPSLWNPVLDQT